MADYYVDNNETIYATQRSFVPTMAAGNQTKTYLGLADLTDLSGQSTMFVNWVRFEWWGHASQGGVGESYGHTVAAILPRSIGTAAGAAGNYHDLADFQVIKGWPIKNSKRFYYSYCGTSNNSNNISRTVFTYNPKNTLVLNRDQVLYLVLDNNYGQPISGLLSIVAQLKRGD